MRSLIFIAALAAIVLFAGTSLAHTSDEHGEVTFHDSEDGPPTDSMECEFWVKGQNMTHEEGEIDVHHDEDRHQHGHVVAEFNGTENENGTYDFEIGPLEFHSHFTSGNEMRWTADLPGNHSTPNQEIHYRQCEDRQRPLPGDDPHSCTGPTPVTARHDGSDIIVEWEPSTEFVSHFSVYRSQAGERDFDTIAQVDKNETSYRDGDVQEGVKYTYFVTHRQNQTGRESAPCDHAQITAQGDPAPACPKDVRAEAREDGDIALSWEASDNATSYNVHRATEDAGFTRIAETNETSHVDGDTEAETTYAYRITAVNEHGESQDCGTVEATAIPTFPNGLLVGLAAIGGVGVFLAVGKMR